MDYFNSNFILILLTLPYVLLLQFAYAVPLATVLQYDNNIDDDAEIIETPSNYLEELDSSPTKDIIDLSFYGQAIFGSPDEEKTAELVANYTPESNVNPEELGSYLEGDILLPTDKMSTGRGFSRNGVLTQSSRWVGGIIPFEIRGNFDANDLATIQHAMEEYHRHTCIRFVPRTNQQDYISIVSGNSGCWSSVGRVGGRQEVNLQSPGCLSKPGTPIHELMHAVGFLHEQNRQERDGYVTIQYQNIQQHAISNFDKAATQAFGVQYDYGSVMHYSANAFSSNGRPTIVAVQPSGNARMGQREGFSPSDVEKINKMYECNLNGNGAVPVPAPAVPGPIPPPIAPVAPTAPGGGVGIIGSFLGGLISGLGLGEEQSANSTLVTSAK